MALRLIKSPHEVTRLNDEHLDEVTASGTYHQNLIARASVKLGYPERNAGLLEVWNPDGGMVYQRFTVFWSGDMYYRGKYLDKWGPWKKILTE